MLLLLLPPPRKMPLSMCLSLYLLFFFFFFFFPALFHRLMGFVGWTRTSPAQTQCLQMRQNLIAGVCAAGHSFTQRRNK